MYSRLHLNRFFIIASAVLASLALPLVAQTSATQDTKWFVVQSETEPVRCGDQEIYYTIEEYKRGTMLAVDGVSGEYSKVRYPAKLGAFVPARDVQSIKAGSFVRLTAASQLSAASMLRGLEGSWCPVFEEPLEVDTEMMVLEIIRDDASDEVLGYRVAPPRPPASGAYPYAYIRTKSLRPATEDEIKSHQGGKQIKTGQPSLMPAHPNSKTTPNQAADNSTSQNAEPLTDLREPMNKPVSGKTGGQGGDTAPAAEQTKPAAQPEVIKNTVPVVTSPEKSGSVSSSNTKRSPATMTASSLEALEASFTNARSMPRAQLDEALPELLAEFNRARDAASDDDESVQTSLDQRIEWINIRIKTRDQRRAIAQALASADTQSIELSQKMDAWNSSRVYSMVGRMMLSGVYTGEHLPLMYRLRAPDRVTGIEKTIGYIAPRADQDFRHLLGRVVGVVGNPVRDDALSLMVLEPARVDLMPGQ
tara:strand:- start:168857 stop:170287 length:1431 start_codon:yes stop_codon:yes gene_type:complete